MKVGLFVPCIVNEFFPDHGMAAFELLEKFGVEVEYPFGQTCCGQPLYNSGVTKEMKPLIDNFVKMFEKYDYVVSPSGSCTSIVKHKYPMVCERDSAVAEVSNKSYELVEFLHDILKVDSFPDASFPHEVVLHNSCHTQREMKLGSSSELNIPYYNKIENLLGMVPNIQLKTKERDDECCGFGGTFSVVEEAASCRMGTDRLDDYEGTGAKYITSTDSSCMFHMDGLIRRQNRDIRIIHVAQIFNGARV